MWCPGGADSRSPECAPLAAPRCWGGIGQSRPIAPFALWLRALRPQPVPRAEEVREHPERPFLHGAFREGPAAHLREAPQALDGVKRMLDHRSIAGPRPVDGIPVVRSPSKFVDEVSAAAQLPLRLSSPL